MDSAEFRRRFEHHAPADERVIHRHHTVRQACLHLAKVIDNMVPEGREKSLAITATEQAMMWANAGIARQLPDALGDELVSEPGPPRG